MKIAIAIICVVIVGCFLLTPSQWNPFTEKGEIEGIFVNGYCEGYGEFCGQYPYTYVVFKNATWNKKHFYGLPSKLKISFGNQFEDIDKMIPDTTYKLWYHKEGRPSDTTSGDTIYYWVIDGYETL